MNVYNYKAVDKNGLKYFGIVRAVSTAEAESKIKTKGLDIVSMEMKNAVLDKIIGKIALGYISPWEKSANLRQMGTMVKAGVPLVRALRVVEKTNNPNLKKTFSAIVSDVCEGQKFSDACKKHPKFLSPVDVHILEAGEATGTLDKALQRLADQKEQEAIIKKSIQGAMLYPIIVLIVIVIVVALMIAKVVPVLADTFASAGQPLPYTTQLLLDMANILNNFWWLIMLFSGAVIILLTLYFRKMLLGRYLWGYFKLRAPVFGNLHQSISLAQICNTLNLLIASSVSIVDSVKLTGGVANNEIYNRTFMKISKVLEEGRQLSTSLEVYPKIFPAILVNMVSAGEESGNIEQMLAVLANFYQNDSEIKIKTLTSSMEPLLIILLGIGVAFVIMAVMVPLANLASVYQ